MLSEQFLNRTNRAIAEPKPNKLRRMTEQQTTLLEIGILGDDGISVLLRIVPDAGVCGVLETNIPHMNATGVEIEKQARQLWDKFWSNSNFMPEELPVCARDPLQKLNKHGCPPP